MICDQENDIRQRCNRLGTFSHSDSYLNTRDGYNLIFFKFLIFGKNKFLNYFLLKTKTEPSWKLFCKEHFLFKKKSVWNLNTFQIPYTWSFLLETTTFLTCFFFLVFIRIDNTKSFTQKGKRIKWKKKLLKEEELCTLYKNIKSFII